MDEHLQKRVVVVVALELLDLQPFWELSPEMAVLGLLVVLTVYRQFPFMLAAAVLVQIVVAAL